MCIYQCEVRWDVVSVGYGLLRIKNLKYITEAKPDIFTGLKFYCMVTLEEIDMFSDSRANSSKLLLSNKLCRYVVSVIFSTFLSYEFRLGDLKKKIILHS